MFYNHKAGLRNYEVHYTWRPWRYPCLPYTPTRFRLGRPTLSATRTHAPGANRYCQCDSWPRRCYCPWYKFLHFSLKALRLSTRRLWLRRVARSRGGRLLASEYPRDVGWIDRRWIHIWRAGAEPSSLLARRCRRFYSFQDIHQVGGRNGLVPYEGFSNRIGCDLF